MPTRRILYLGDDFEHCTSAHRAATLARLGHSVTHVNPRSVLPRSRLIGGISTRLGFGVFSPLVNVRLKKIIGREKYDLIWIDTGAELSSRMCQWLRERGGKIVNYNADDPFGPRDGRKWHLYLDSVPYMDFTVVVRPENISEANARGARKVVWSYRSYDPVAHAPSNEVSLSGAQMKRWTRDVVFVGTWMPERVAFLSRLRSLGVPLTIFGDRWREKCSDSDLLHCHEGEALYSRDYVHAIQFAKVALGLLSKGNRDNHTTRSLEIPFIGGAVFCAQRTAEHSRLYKEGQEAVFWSSADECAVECKKLLDNEPRRAEIAQAGRDRVIQCKLSNDDVLQAILDILDGISPSHEFVHLAV